MQDHTPISDELKDEHGGIANAIFELERDKVDRHGLFSDRNNRLTAWLYSSSLQQLTYHVHGEGTWMVTVDKAELIDNRGYDARTIYRPFLSPMSPNSTCLRVIWCKTREQVVQKKTYPRQTPYLLAEAHRRVLDRLEKIDPGARLQVLIPYLSIDRAARTPVAVHEILTRMLDATQRVFYSPQNFFPLLRSYLDAIPEEYRDPSETGDWLTHYWQQTLKQAIFDAVEILVKDRGGDVGPVNQEGSGTVTLSVGSADLLFDLYRCLLPNREGYALSTLLEDGQSKETRAWLEYLNLSIGERTL